MSFQNAWPPPPDLHSIQELVAASDIESFIAEGSPADEYETEAEDIFNVLQSWPTSDLTTERILPVVEGAWTQSFGLDDKGLEQRRVKLRELAGQIERFFGPGARPQVRGA